MGPEKRYSDWQAHQNHRPELERTVPEKKGDTVGVARWAECVFCYLNRRRGAE